MVRHGIDKMKFLLGRQRLGDDAAAEDLPQGVGGDEAKAAGFASGNGLGGFPPEMQGQIGALRHFGIGGPEGECVAIAQIGAQILTGDKRRIADDEIRRRPCGWFGAFGAHDQDPVGFVWHLLPGNGVGFGGAAPAGEAGDDFLGAIVQQGVGFFDVVEIAQDRFGDFTAGAVAEVPLQPAKPEHEFRHRHGAGVEFQAEKLVRVHAGLGEVEAVALTGDEIGQQVQNLPFQAFHHIEGDVEEVGGAAGGVEHADGAEAGVVGADEVGGSGQRAILGFGQCGGFDAIPFFEQRVHDGGLDQTFHEGARGEVGAELAALPGIDRVFQQGAEDGGFDLRPIAAGGDDQEV